MLLFEQALLGLPQGHHTLMSTTTANSTPQCQLTFPTCAISSCAFSSTKMTCCCASLSRCSSSSAGGGARPPTTAVQHTTNTVTVLQSQMRMFSCTYSTIVSHHVRTKATAANDIRLPRFACTTVRRTAGCRSDDAEYLLFNSMDMGMLSRDTPPKPGFSLGCVEAVPSFSLFVRLYC